MGKNKNPIEKVMLHHIKLLKKDKTLIDIERLEILEEGVKKAIDLIMNIEGTDDYKDDICKQLNDILNNQKKIRSS
ncbi:MAG: hypothetical protein PHN31_05270 [Candidatus Gracilibacteria bacterium]|nr:hypothetical protein [Candidatus Gracilibacteria bacterium]